jgi:hypothetical protein
MMTGIGWWVNLQQPVTVRLAFTAFKAAPLLVVLTGLDMGYLLLMAIFVRRKFVFQAATEYTDALFRTLDTPATPRA